ncbi:MAG: hypothetical protein ACI9U5_001333, partial [Colwellia sp.]
KGYKPSSDSDMEVNFYPSVLTNLPKRFNNSEYNGHI